MTIAPQWYKITAFIVVVDLLITQTLIPGQKIPLAVAQTPFKDIQNHWAQSCIEDLTEKKIIRGYPEDNTFRPDIPVSRIQFAILVRRAFPNAAPFRKPINFIDIPTNYWGKTIIREAYQAGFISAYVGSIFNPNEPILRWQALVGLTNGLRYAPTSPSVEILTTTFTDASDIPESAKNGILAATEQKLVVNYPNIKKLNPKESATRAEVASFLCQALLKKEQKSLISPTYIAQLSTGNLTPKTEIVESGKVKAEFSYEPQGEDGKNFRVKITREGQVILDEPVLIPTRLSTKNNQNSPLEGLSEGRFLSLQVKDLDRDGEPDVLLDLVGKNQGKKTCCNYSFIYSYDRSNNKYSVLKHSWGNSSYELVDLFRDNHWQFKSVDERFNDIFTPGADSRSPIRIWQYNSPGKLEDVTRFYPLAVYTNASELWVDANTRLKNNQETKGVLAAYLATKYLLKQETEGWQLVQQVYQGRDRAVFFSKLKQFLENTGYASAISQQQPPQPVETPQPSPIETPQPTPVTTPKPQPKPPQPQNKVMAKLELIQTFSDGDNEINSIALSPNGKLLVSGGTQEIKIWNLETGEVINTLSGHGGKIWSLAFSFDGKTLVSGSGDGTVILWDIDSGKMSQSFNHKGWVNTVSFNIDAKFVLSGSHDKGIKIWDVTTGNLVATLEGNIPMTIAAQGRLLASGSEAKTIKLWDIPKQELFKTLPLPEGFGENLRTLAFSREGFILAYVMSGKSPIFIWDLRTEKVINSSESNRELVNGLAISPNNLFFASSSQDNTLKLWHLPTGKLLQTVEGYGAIAWSRDSQILANFGKDNKIRLWRVQTMVK
ncbi:MAG: hypothetical protein RLZZ338_3281 [Cyanobacteriota bacterium]|jgi:WD40 repeat protein